MAILVLYPCTKTKALPALGTCKARVVAKIHNLHERASVWTQALKKAKQTTNGLAASSMYRGPAWASLREMPQQYPEHHFGILSAGYGTLAWEEVIVPYSATFKSTDPDAVIQNTLGPNHQSCQDWWDGLHTCQSRPPITEWAQCYQPMSILIVATTSYITAITTDIQQARNWLPHPDNLLILGTSPPTAVDLQDAHVPVSVALRPVVGGGDITLGVRLSQRLLEYATTVECLTATNTRKWIAEQINNYPEATKTSRQPVTTENLKRLVQEAKGRNPGITNTRCLRTLRQQNIAVGSERLRRVWDEMHNAEQPT
jgi:hypothetical protein